MKKEEFKILFDENFDALRNYIYYRYPDSEIATDIAQEVFIKVWERTDDKSPKEIVPLLYKIARDMVVSLYRHEDVKGKFRAISRPIDHPCSPEEQLQYQELVERYESALNQMPKGQREVFLMSRNDELKYSEIAQRLNISVKAIEKRMQGALKFLRRVLNSEF